MEPNKMFPLVVGEATGDIALLEDKVIVDEIGVFDGPGCGLGNDVPVIILIENYLNVYFIIKCTWKE